jgi:hypothetical protein
MNASWDWLRAGLAGVIASVGLAPCEAAADCGAPSFEYRIAQVKIEDAETWRVGVRAKLTIEKALPLRIKPEDQVPVKLIDATREGTYHTVILCEPALCRQLLAGSSQGRSVRAVVGLLIDCPDAGDIGTATVLKVELPARDGPVSVPLLIPQPPSR